MDDEIEDFDDSDIIYPEENLPDYERPNNFVLLQLTVECMELRRQKRSEEWNNHFNN